MADEARAASPPKRVLPGAAPKTEKQKMLAGEPYLPMDPELWADRVNCRRLLRRYNHEIEYGDSAAQRLLLAELLGTISQESPPFLEPPFRCDYGYNIHIGTNFYCNFNCIVLDCGQVNIGDRVLLGPNVQIYAVGHHLDPAERSGPDARETAPPIVIKNDVWVGGSAVILGGVTVGEGSTVAAGAVVTADVPPYSVVGGNPARVIRVLQREATADPEGFVVVPPP